MDIETAEKKIRDYLAKIISIKFIEDPYVTGIYNFDPEKDYLFSYSLSEQTCIGKGNYIVISKETGQVKSTGFWGE